MKSLDQHIPGDLIQRASFQLATQQKTRSKKMPLGIILTEHNSQPCSTLSNFENKSRPCCRRLRITTDDALLNQLHCFSGIQNHASATVLSNF